MTSFLRKTSRRYRADPFPVSLVARVSKNYLHVDNVFLSHYSQRVLSLVRLKKGTPLFRILIILRSIIVTRLHSERFEYLQSNFHSFLKEKPGCECFYEIMDRTHSIRCMNIESTILYYI